MTWWCHQVVSPFDTITNKFNDVGLIKSLGQTFKHTKQTTMAVNTSLQFGNRDVACTDILLMLDFLVDGGAFTMEEANQYCFAVRDHYHHGILPGFTRFPLPGGRDMYFLPALTTIWDFYIEPASHLMQIRDDWRVNPTEENIGYALSDASDNETVDTVPTTASSRDLDENQMTELVGMWLETDVTEDDIIDDAVNGTPAIDEV